MTIFTRRRVRQSLLEEYEAPFWQSMGATWDDPLNQTVLLPMRRRELVRAERGAEPNFLDINPFGEEAPSTVSPMVNAETARSRIVEEGLDLTVPDAGIRQRALDILIERKRDERRRNDLIARGPKGFWAGAARLGVAFGAGASDPLNAAFVLRRT